MLNDLLEDFDVAFNPLIVTRYTGRTNTNGVITNSSMTLSPAPRGTVVPMTGFDLINIPEGERPKNWMKLYCDTQLNTSSQNQNIPSDIVQTSDGLQYKVMRVRPWKMDQDGYMDPCWEIDMVELNP